VNESANGLFTKLLVASKIFMHFRSVILISLQCLIAFASLSGARAQTLDPYRRINDPLAIADLGGPDSGRIMRDYSACGNDGPFDWDGYTIQAQDSGTGIIRHLWVVYTGGANPDTDYMKLWVDDSLLIDGSVRQFFSVTHGLISSPLDTSSSGAEVCDVQIPYFKNFKWTHHGDWHWRGSEWQHIDTSKTALPKVGSTTLAIEQSAANINYWKTDPWQAGNTISFQKDISSGDTMLLADIQGPAYIQKLHFQFAGLNTAVLQQLWISLYWDKCPTPSISLPLSDLFGITMGATDINAFRIFVDNANGTLDLTFPMPFKVDARLTILNQSNRIVSMQGTISYQDTTWCSSWGYFSTQYHITPEISYHLLHPTLHAKGSGRFIGTILNYPDSTTHWPYYLEGDGYVMADSLPYNLPGISTHYGGVEDYCDGGWYFVNQTIPAAVWPPSFSLPFRGCPNWPATEYRFFINAPYNYEKSIDVSFGHGFNDDYPTTMRTTAFYYTAWTPFYPSSDTIVAGNEWTITGAGYAPETPLVAELDSDTIYQGKAAADGSLWIRMNVSKEWKIGDHTLSINGVEKPELITILSQPKLVYVQDSAGRTFSERDSIEIRAYGFDPGEKLRPLLGDTAFTDIPLIVADTDGVARWKSFLPWVPQGLYHLYVVRESGDRVTSDSALYVTRTLNYEFELMQHAAPGDTNAGYDYASFSDKHFSQGALEFCGGNYHRGSTFAFEFETPYADSFKVTVFASIAHRFGIYKAYLNGVELGERDWFVNVPFPAIFRDSEVFQNVYIRAGKDTITFVNDGWADSANEYSIALDNLHLSPLSAETKTIARVDLESYSALSLYPDPVTQNILHIKGVSSDNIPITIYSSIGKRVMEVTLSHDRSLNISTLQNGNYWMMIEDGSARGSLPFTVIR